MFTRGTCSISESSPTYLFLRRSHCAPRNLKIMPPGTDSPILPPSCYADPRAARLPWCPRNTRCLWKRPTIQVRMPWIGQAVSPSNPGPEGGPLQDVMYHKSCEQLSVRPPTLFLPPGAPTKEIKNCPLLLLTTLPPSHTILHLRASA